MAAVWAAQTASASRFTQPGRGWETATAAGPEARMDPSGAMAWALALVVPSSRGRM